MYCPLGCFLTHRVCKNTVIFKEYLKTLFYFVFFFLSLFLFLLMIYECPSPKCAVLENVNLKAEK